MTGNSIDSTSKRIQEMLKEIENESELDRASYRVAVRLGLRFFLMEMEREDEDKNTEGGR